MSWGAPLTSTERRELEAREDAVRAKRKTADHHAAITGCVGTGEAFGEAEAQQQHRIATHIYNPTWNMWWTLDGWAVASGEVFEGCTADTAVREGVRHD